MRALGVELPGLSRKSIENRPNPPGQHGARQRRRSEYAVQLAEKQKVRFNYGLGETQLRRLVAEAERSRAPTGEKLIELAERRLDNLVFRAGFAPTGIAARQLVRHGHVLLNGRRADIPSIRVKPGDTIALTERGARVPMVIESLAAPALDRPEWIAFDAQARSARVARLPNADEAPFPVDLKQIVEYYANRL
jgi:small subunit ribosomal protein S4